MNINPFEMSTKPTLHTLIELSLCLSSLSVCLLSFVETQILPREFQPMNKFMTANASNPLFHCKHPLWCFANSQHFRNKILHLSVTNIKFLWLGFWMAFFHFSSWFISNCWISYIRVAFGLLQRHENITADTCLIPSATPFWTRR